MIFFEKKTLLAFILGAVLASWSLGFLSFVDQVKAYRQPAIDATLAPTQAIVVLTGGSERVVAGLDLLKAGKGVKLLISGVHASVKEASLLPASALSDDLRSCCVVLGREAGNTRGNAAETKAFMDDNHYDTLTLVTAHYHMPRSLLLFKSAMPDKQITPFPVLPDSVDLASWWRRVGTASLLFGEYNKYLFATVCLWLGVY
ncbi:MAG: YdcF family protein [Bdellovibrionales bacterium]|jgi:uncharacterized SAM-binding protein YcdF (DUF218 family)